MPVEFLVYRNRLTRVSHFATYVSPADQIVDYVYDYQNRLIGKILDSDADNYADSSVVFVHDGDQVALQFDHTGTVTDYLPSENWYDARGSLIKTATGNGLFQKYAYDGLGRIVATYTCYDTNETAYADANNVTGDTVVEQSQTWYNAAGETVAMATFERLPDDTATDGELTAANSYATASVAWHDGIGRVVATANFGREDKDSGFAHYFFNGSTGALIDTNINGIPDVAEQSRASNDIETVVEDAGSQAGFNFQLTLIAYNAAGQAYRTIDNLGRINETQFDDAGRTTKTIQNYNDGSYSETETDQDIIVDYEYDSGGRLATMTAYNALGDDSNPSNENVQEQATKYLYESEINASWQTGVIYPDSTDTVAPNGIGGWTITSGSDHVSTDYDQLGRTTETTDQRGVIHTYTYDTAGRLSADTVTDLGSSGIVDGSVRRVDTDYDDVGRVQSVTNYSNIIGTAIVNQVEYTYNGWGQVYREYQEHDGAVDGNTPFVQYDYDDGASGNIAKYVRLDKVTYPDGREVNYDYGSTGAIDDIMSRLASIKDDDDSTVLASYKYLGGGTIVEENYEDIDVKLDYNADGNLGGFDRFGRVVDQLWEDYDAEEALDEYLYAYDQAGNRLWKENDVAANLGTPVHLDELYDYDGLDQLLGMERGNLVSGAITSPDFTQDWDLDGLGNWAGFDDDGTAQTRDTNAANEIETISNWIDPTYDAAGNMISGPAPGDETTRVHYVYDAWNRLVEVREDDSGPGDLIAEYEYDGLNRRVEKIVDEGTSHSHYYYNQGWQMLEEEFVDGGGTTVARNQYVWSPRYIDSPIVRFHDDNGDGDLEDVGDNTRYYTSDANHNITATFDAATGAVVERYVYTAYGEATVYDSNWSNPAAPTEDGPLYGGYFFDAESDLYQVRNRYYDSSLSTFISRDPIGYDGGMNLYEYVYDSPINLIDPNGLQAPISIMNLRDPNPNRLPPWTEYPGYEGGNNSGNIVFTNWLQNDPDRARKYVNAIQKHYQGEITAAARKHNLPEALILGGIISESINYGWADYHNFGRSLGPGQLTKAIIKYYEVQANQLSVEAMAAIYDRQLEEIALAAKGGGTLICPSGKELTIPPMSTEFMKWAGGIKNSNALCRKLRANNPAVISEFFGDGLAPLMGLLISMNRNNPGATSNPNGSEQYRSCSRINAGIQGPQAAMGYNRFRNGEFKMDPKTGKMIWNF